MTNSNLHVLLGKTTTLRQCREIAGRIWTHPHMEHHPIDATLAELFAHTLFNARAGIDWTLTQEFSEGEKGEKK